MFLLKHKCKLFEVEDNFSMQSEVSICHLKTLILEENCKCNFNSHFVSFALCQFMGHSGLA